MTNKDLAAAAADLANTSPPGLTRRAAGCACVVLSTTKTVAGAKKALTQARLDDEIRDAAQLLVDALAAKHTQAATETAATEGTA